MFYIIYNPENWRHKLMAYLGWQFIFYLVFMKGFYLQLIIKINKFK